MPLPGRHTQGVTTTVAMARSTRRPTRSAAATTTLGVLLALFSILVSALALAAPAQAAGTGHVRLPAQAKLAHACSVTSTMSFHTTTKFRCFAERRTDIAPLPHGTTTSASFKAARAAAGFKAAVTPPGLHPADLTAAYQLPSSTRGVGQTVYIVDAYNYPNAESDLAVYRAQYGLPACTTANGCFRKVNQNGLTSPLPATDNGWAAEMALDLDMVSAVCPNCNITLVEANDSSGNMMTAVAPGQHDGREVRLDELGRGREQERGGVRRGLLQALRRRLHGILRRQRLQRRALSRVVQPGRGRRRHVAEPGEQRPRLDRERLVRRRQRLLGSSRTRPPGRPATRAAPRAPSPTSLPSPTPRPG